MNDRLNQDTEAIRPVNLIRSIFLNKIHHRSLIVTELVDKQPIFLKELLLNC